MSDVVFLCTHGVVRHGGGIPERFEADIMLRKALKSMVVVQGDLITEIRDH
ncbi:hypothetical protein [Pantoea ananatis]|uniref:hypothetical protein n=1 Tax=Pantoea ananas TaxID=553 RepID=UPI002350F4C0|nr:hypothetical protein [Pantoea ananatis]